MPNEFVAKNGIIAQNNSVVSGSLVVTNGITGSLFGTSSQAVSASYTATSSFGFNAVSASYAFTASSASNSFSASYAQTSSFANNFTVANTLTAQTLVVSTISSSVVYSSGSNIFGNSLSNTQVLTGSVGITGSLTVRGNQVTSGSSTITGSLTVSSGITGSLFGTASQATSASFAFTASYLLGYISPFPFTGSAQITGSLGVTGSTDITGSLSATGLGSFGTKTTSAITDAGVVIYRSNSSSSLNLVSTSDFSTTPFSGITFSAAISSSLAPTTRAKIVGGKENSAANNARGYLAFYGSQTNEAFRISSNNVILIGTTTEVGIPKLQIGGAVTGSSGTFRAQLINASFTASANGDNLIALDINPTFTLGAFTGSNSIGIVSRIASGSGTFNLYMSGSAANFLSGSTGIGKLPSGAQLDVLGSTTITGSLNVSGSITTTGAITASAALINGTITAQTLVVSTVSSSVVYSSGSNRFGDDVSDQQTFTGSVNISGSLTLVGRGTINDLTGSLFGTASWATNFITGSVTSASFASTASFVNTLNQNVVITGSLTIGTGSGNSAAENTLTIGPAGAGGSGEGGQLLLMAKSDGFTSASMLDTYQNRFRLLRGTNTGSTGEVFSANLNSGQIVFPSYTSVGAFSGTVAANLAVDSSGNILTVATGSGGGSAFPFTGSAQITGSLGVTGSISASGAIISTANGTMYFRGGDDAELWDINVTNTVGVYGQQDQTVASIKLGSGGGTISGRSGNIGIGTITPNSASLHINGNVFATSFTGSLLGTAASASYAFTASSAVSSSYAFTASSAISSSFAVNYLGSGSISTRLTNLETASGSLSTRVTNTETTASNLVAASASFSTRITNDSSSLSARETRTEITASNLVAASGSFSTRVTQIERTYATTGSNIFTGSQNILGAITASAALINGTLTAQTLVVTTISSSVVFSSGSNIFGNSTANTQTMTGSLNVSGSATIIGRVTATNITGSLFGTASWATNFITGSVTSASYAFTASSAISSSLAQTSSFSLRGSGAFTGSFSGSVTASLFGTASQATSASYSYTASSAISASYALTASFALNGGGGVSFPYTGSAQITGSLGVTGSFSVNANQGSSVFSSNADTLLITGSLVITGSGAITGSLSVSSGITGSLFGTASWAQNALTASFLIGGGSGIGFPFTGSAQITGSLGVTGSFLVGAGSSTMSYNGDPLQLSRSGNTLSIYATNGGNGNLSQISSTFGLQLRAANSSYIHLPNSNNGIGVNNTTPQHTLDVSGSGRYTSGLIVTGSTQITGSLAVTGSLNVSGAITTNGTITAQTLVVQTITSSITYSSGSNIFGNALTNTQTMTGSVNITGSLTLNGNQTVFGVVTVQSASFDYGQNLSVSAGGYQVIASEATSSFRCAFFDYVMFSGSIVRAGTVTSTWSGSATEYYENYTADLGGNTSGVLLQTAISAGNIQLQASASTAAWTIRSLIRLL